MRSRQGRGLVETTLWEILARKSVERAGGGRVSGEESWGDSIS